MSEYQTVNKPISWFRANPENYRSHPQEQQAVLQESLRRFGVFRNVVARPDGTILAGHGILAAAAAEGLTEFPCVLFDGTDAEARALMVADNEQARLAEDDADQLSQLLTSLQDDGLLTVSGHDEESLAQLLEEVAAQAPPTGVAPQEDEGPGEPPVVPVTQPGDVWLMGELGHRLVCGDSLAGEAPFTATGGKQVACVLTDPPYAIFGSSTGIASDIADDRMVVPFFESVLRLAEATLKDFGHCYAFCDWRSWAAWWEAARRTGMVPKNAVVWDKGSGQGSMYAQCYELIGFWVKQPTETALGQRATGHRTIREHAQNVIRINRVPSDEREGHNAAKPAELLGLLLENSTDPGEMVLEPFMGSGSTLIACEKLGRVCAGVEVEPKWVDVSVRRWQRLTGETATLESDGTPFPASE